MVKNTEIPPFRYIERNEILLVFKAVRDYLEPAIKRQYHNHHISKGVAVDRQQVLVIAEKLMVAIHDSRMDPKDVIEWIKAIGTSEEEVAALNETVNTSQPHLAHTSPVL